MIITTVAGPWDGRQPRPEVHSPRYDYSNFQNYYYYTSIICVQFSFSTTYATDATTDKTTTTTTTTTTTATTTANSTFTITSSALLL